MTTRKPRARRVEPIPASEPIPAVILAIDPGTHAGYCVTLRGVYESSGTVKRGGEAVPVEAAVYLATRENLPLLVVAEKWTPGGRFSGLRTMISLGAAWGRWEGAVLAASVPMSRVVRVYPATWRAYVGIRPGTRREAIDEHVSAYARAYAGEAMRTDDEADAVCIAAWSATSALVRGKVPQRRRRLPPRAE